MKANRTHVHLWSSLNNVKGSDVLEQIDDDFQLFEQWIDEAGKDFPKWMFHRDDAIKWFKKWFGDSDA